MSNVKAARTGLDGIVVAETVLSHVDGECGVLWVRGHTLAELVAEHGFEGAVAILWDGFAGDALDRPRIVAELGRARVAAFARLEEWLSGPAQLPYVEGLRRCLAALADDSDPAAILAAFPVAIAALLRVRRGLTPVPPDPNLSTAADLLRMIAGTLAEARAVAALDAYFTTVIDNGLNASTFTARVVASTRASLVSAILAAYCAFTGPLHGGAPGPVLDMLDEIAASGDIDAWLERKLGAGGRVMGFGHRVFRHGDPRAAVLRQALDEFGADQGRLAFAAEFERRALAAFARLRPGQPLRPNVEISAALLLDAVGLPREAFTPVFALARSAGWIAHALEQQKTARYIRPASVYIGPPPSA